MGLAIYLRKRETVNKFRDLLLDSIGTGLGDEAIICSGFIQENYSRSHFQASNEGHFDDILLANNIKLTTVGIYNKLWEPSYRLFRDNLKTKGVNIIAKLSRRMHWHAKIYILLKGGCPIFAIIGSSNLTRNAFGKTAPFNFESDVVLWVDEYQELKSLIDESISELSQFSSEIIIADYNPDKNFGLTIENRLKQLIRDINDTELIELQ